MKGMKKAVKAAASSKATASPKASPKAKKSKVGPAVKAYEKAEAKMGNSPSKTQKSELLELKVRNLLGWEFYESFYFNFMLSLVFLSVHCSSLLHDELMIVRCDAMFVQEVKHTV